MQLNSENFVALWRGFFGKFFSFRVITVSGFKHISKLYCEFKFESSERNAKSPHIGYEQQ